jgi:Alw26I/Eco31I/Esp3I family type II restriction m6 adenine DNA methyltransferase
MFIEEIINKSCIYGVEVDPKIYKMAQIVLKFKIYTLLGVSNNLSNLFCKNTITTPLQQLFPSIFHQNPKGFDIVIGNPPWEILKPNKREFFENYHDNYIHLSREKQDEVQNRLLKNGHMLKIYEKYIQSYTTQAETVSSLGYSYQSSKMRKKTYTGDPQLFKIFLEIAFMAVKNNGVISLIVQHNFLGSKSCAALRSLYLHNGKFSGVWEFYNKIKNSLIFKNVDPNLRFIIIQFKKELNQQSDINYKKCDSIESLQEDFVPYQKIPIEFYHKLSEEEIQLFGFKGEGERSAFEKLLSSENDFSKLKWINSNLELTLEQDLHVTRDRNKFSKEPTSIPIYGGKNFGPYYVHKGEHRYLIEDTVIAPEKMKSSIVCRNVLPNSVKRIIFSTAPPKTLVDNSCTRLVFNSEDPLVLFFFLAVANSLTVEFFLRTILTGINLNYYLIRRIPLPSENILNDTKYKNKISELCKLTQKIQKTESESENWATFYAKMEAIIAILFKLTKNELSVILDSFNFEKLQKTNLSKSKPFHKLTKEMILNHFESESSRLT